MCEKFIHTTKRGVPILRHKPDVCGSEFLRVARFHAPHHFVNLRHLQTCVSFALKLGSSCVGVRIAHVVKNDGGRFVVELQNRRTIEPFRTFRRKFLQCVFMRRKVAGRPHVGARRNRQRRIAPPKRADFQFVGTVPRDFHVPTEHFKAGIENVKEFDRPVSDSVTRDDRLFVEFLNV